MLKRVSGGLFEAATGDTIQVFAIAAANNGVETARFEYNNVRLGSTPTSNHPGCQFVVVAGTRTFEAEVVFSGTQGRYDLFQVNSAGGSSSLGQSVTANDITPLIAFRVSGVALGAVAASTPAAGTTRGAARAIAPTGVTLAAPAAAEPAREVAKAPAAGKKKAAQKAGGKRSRGAAKTTGKAKTAGKAKATGKTGGRKGKRIVKKAQHK